MVRHSRDRRFHSRHMKHRRQLGQLDSLRGLVRLCDVQSNDLKPVEKEERNYLHEAVSLTPRGERSNSLRLASVSEH